MIKTVLNKLITLTYDDGSKKTIKSVNKKNEEIINYYNEYNFFTNNKQIVNIVISSKDNEKVYNPKVKAGIYSF